MQCPRLPLESAYEWYTSYPRQRLQPGGKIVLVMTRWSTKDLTGMLVKNQTEAKADQWHVVEFQQSWIMEQIKVALLGHSIGTR